MKKFAKISAVLAALVLALAFAGCSSGDDDDDDDDDGGMKSVSLADDLKFSGTYRWTVKAEGKTGDYKGRYSIEKGTVTITGTEPDSSVVMIQTYDEKKYTVKSDFDEEKERPRDSENIKFEFDEENLIIKTTYIGGKDKEELYTYSEFKKEYLDPEDYEDEDKEAGWKVTDKYTDKSLKMADDGSRIVSSYTCISAYTEYGKTESGTSEHTFTLERQ